jgi:hypothetical protein
MKPVNLPSIIGIEEVLNVMLDPERYIAYMRGLRDLHAEVKVSLGLIQTVAQADTYTAEALRIKEQAAAELLTSRAKLTKDSEDLAAREAMVVKSEHEYAEFVNQRTARLEEREQDTLKLYAVADQFRKTEEAELAAKHGEADKRIYDLDQREATLTKRAEQLKAAALALSNNVE